MTARTRTQRYRLTHEFVLKDRADYALARDLLRTAIDKVWEHFLEANPDYMAIEKVTDKKVSS